MPTRNSIGLVGRGLPTLQNAESRADLIRWVVGGGFLQAVLVTALLLKFVK